MARHKTRHVRDVGSVYWDENGERWVGQVECGKYENGRTKFKRFYDTSQETVILKMKEYKKQAVLTEVGERQNLITVKDYFETYLTNIKKKKLKPSSYDRQYRTFRDHICPYIGGHYLIDLTGEIIQQQLLDRLCFKGYSYSTVTKVYVLVNECLNYASIKGVIQTNPCSFVPKPSKNTFAAIKDIRFFDDDEIQRFIEATLVKNSKNNYVYTNGLPLIILIYTGLRGGELLALQWKDVDLENKYIKVHKNIASIVDGDKRQVFIQEGTKTRKSRIVHLTKSALIYFQQLRELRNPKPSDYVIITDGIRDFSAIRNSYTGICARANIDNPQTPSQILCNHQIARKIKEQNFNDETDGKSVGLICILTQCYSVVKM